jgi:hypothetical protein
MKVRLCAAILSLAASRCMLGDVSYEESVRYTGGSLVEMMRGMNSGLMGKMMGGRLGKALQDHTDKIYLKGNKMAHVSPDMTTIFDLDAGTVTTVDNGHRTYSSMTFDEMNQRMQEARARMSKTGGQGPNVQFKAKVESTGQTKTVNGMDAKETVMTITAEGDQGAGMQVHSNMWMVSSVPGYDELRSFYKQFSGKLGGITAGFNPMMGGASAGLSELAKETSKLDGFPVAEDTTVSGVQSPMGGMMGGRNTDPNAPFLTMSTETSNFSNGPVNDSVFTIPDGYKEQRRR